MVYLPAEIIKAKREGRELSPVQIDQFIARFVADEIPDYQMSALLMAIYFKGMSARETSALTMAMMRSGRSLDFRDLGKPSVDKHSTGGIGDKTTLILAPIVAAAGAAVPMIAGRGLGHTGGTLDKLEAISGFNVRLSLDEFARAVRARGIAIMGQTEEICPADRRMYALRDVTATVESLPLICASIMSKKLAEGTSALVLDVKHGSGAFMKTREQADALADGLLAIARANGRRASAFLTTVDEPLGRFVGNALEVGECLAILRQSSFMGRAAAEFADTRELSLRLAGEMIFIAGLKSTADDGYREAERLLNSGAAAEKFEELSRAQGAPDVNAFPRASFAKRVLAAQNGFIGAFNCETIGLAAIALGAGRLKTSDAIDHAAGLEFHLKLGDPVCAGDTICTLHASDAGRFDQASAMVLQATTISLQKPTPVSLITSRKAG